MLNALRSALNSITFPLLVGCATGCPGGISETDETDTATESIDLTIEQSEIATTVFTVWWDAVTEGAVAYVEFSLEEAEEATVAPAQEEEGVYRAVILGLKASRSYTLRAVEERGGETLTSDDYEVTAGDAPAALPTLEAVPLDDAASGGFLATSIVTNPPTAVIIDAEGDYVWWYSFPEHRKYQMSRATPARDLQSVFLRLDVTGGTSVGIYELAWDGTEETLYETTENHHDFVELPDGTLAFPLTDAREIDETEVFGDKITELTPSTGVTVDVWSIHDSDEFVDGVDQAFDWTHTNALDYDEDEEVYYAGHRNLDSIFKIDRATGEVIWRLGGTDSSFTFDQHVPMDTQHQFDVVGDSIYVFDNSEYNMESRVIRYDLDVGAGTATTGWTYEPDPPMYNVALGDVMELENGNVLVTWSLLGQIDEVDADGNLLWQLNTSLGGVFGYTRWYDSLYADSDE